jgi:hypothetical protein
VIAKVGHPVAEPPLVQQLEVVDKRVDLVARYGPVEVAVFVRDVTSSDWSAE